MTCHGRDTSAPSYAQCKGMLSKNAAGVVTPLGVVGLPIAVSWGRAQPVQGWSRPPTQFAGGTHMRIHTIVIWGLALLAAGPLRAQAPPAPDTTRAIDAAIGNEVLQ